MRDYVPYYTEDGSIGLYSYADKDVFHSKYGALTEAWEKFIIPARIERLKQEELKVLDVCYGIGYNTKALMSFIINKNKIENENFIKKFFKKIFKNNNSIVTIDDNNIHDSKIKLSSPIETISANKFSSVLIDCLEINKEIVQLSPLFKTLKTPEEIFMSLVPSIFNCFETYYKLKDLFCSFLSIFMPHNSKEINDLLEIKFKNMHIEKEYKVNKFVNYLLINKLSEIYGKEYPNKEIKKILKERASRRFFDKTYIKYTDFNRLCGYKSSSKHNLSAFLHNIYYGYLSFRNKNVDFKAYESLFKLNFHIKDARKTILELNQDYDLIFLDAFTYTKAPQLWSSEFIAELYKRLAPNGLLLTYSNSVQVRNTLLENGFFVGKIYNEKNKKFVGTVAAKDKKLIEHPLNNYELGLCATKAGIPYHDPNLAFTNKEIKELREYEFRHSPLMSSSKYMKIRSNMPDKGLEDEE